MKIAIKSLGTITAIILFLMLILVPTTPLASAKKNGSGALTTPPTPEFQIMGFFDINNKYLDQGDVSIRDNSNQTATITVTTVAKQSVQKIGATVYLQKWTGTEWIDVGSATTLSGDNKSYFSNSVTKTTTSGYYFRTRTLHWINHSGVYEQGELISGHILVK
ncbi:hypothetical protein [Paenibacillus sp. PL91]|uniref:hypothetical protein n=1 Tax=Paenibacillus sp. PL91 TaxID=2729538 RepID=UPI00145F10D8|nr:hypothetical protein [Paenibacillus sp. PL91]MBC9203734.1 hypothetical protein [Paenibacillus sp. PL91]